ncbi:MAG TPA: hypothetical protein VKV19_09655 [Ktedonobacteraceae bacterium]|nr:hypothetical protein [Ktedonobacteraceae bacterium]
MNTSQYNQSNDDPYKRARPQNQPYASGAPGAYPNQPPMSGRTLWPQAASQNQPYSRQYNGNAPIAYPNQSQAAREMQGAWPQYSPYGWQYHNGAPIAYPNQLQAARKAQGTQQIGAQAKPARMPKERAQALARRFKRGLVVLSLGAFALFSALVAYHQAGTASATTGQKSSSSTSTSTSSSQNDGGFFRQQGGGNFGTGSSSSSGGSSTSSSIGGSGNSSPGAVSGTGVS